MAMTDLSGKVAVVTGASRGAGRGIALVLGEAGTTVYVTGRSVRGESSGGVPGTIDQTADEVTARGGEGVAVRVDHTADAEVGALFERVESEQGRLDLLVNNAWGGNELAIDDRPFWEFPPGHWHNMFEAGVRAALISSQFAAPLMLPRRQGLIVNITFYDRGKFVGNLFYDLAKNALCRLAFGMAEDLRPHGVAAVALSPGWMRTELVLRAFDTDEEHHHHVEMLRQTESVEYIGRAVVALAADPDIMRKSGSTLVVGELAREYGFTDVDGRQVPPFTLPG